MEGPFVWDDGEGGRALLRELLKREKNRLAGAQTFSMEEIDRIAAEILYEKEDA